MDDVAARRIARKRGFGPDGSEHRSYVRLRGGIPRVLRIAGKRQKADRRENRENGNDDDEFREREPRPTFRSGLREDFSDAERNGIADFRSANGIEMFFHTGGVRSKKR